MPPVRHVAMKQGRLAIAPVLGLALSTGLQRSGATMALRDAAIVDRGTVHQSP